MNKWKSFGGILILLITAYFGYMAFVANTDTTVTLYGLIICNSFLLAGWIICMIGTYKLFIK